MACERNELVSPTTEVPVVEGELVLAIRALAELVRETLGSASPIVPRTSIGTSWSSRRRPIWWAIPRR